MNIPILDTVQMKYTCPSCKTKKQVQLPYTSPDLLKDKKRPLQLMTWCSRCNLSHNIKYLAKKDKKIKLVEFTCAEKNFLSRVKKDLVIESNSTLK